MLGIPAGLAGEQLLPGKSSLFSHVLLGTMGRVPGILHRDRGYPNALDGHLGASVFLRAPEKTWA